MDGAEAVPDRSRGAWGAVRSRVICADRPCKSLDTVGPEPKTFFKRI